MIGVRSPVERDNPLYRFTPAQSIAGLFVATASVMTRGLRGADMLRAGFWGGVAGSALLLGAAKLSM